jgi:hypothetical protein
MSQESVIRYFDSKIGAWGVTPGLGYPWSRSVLTRARQAILEALLRLDRLPRGDSFRSTWANSRATMAELDGYCSRLLQENPADEDALWLSAALSLRGCDNDFGSSAWKGLHKLGKLEVAWVIDAAATVELASGVPTIRPLVVLLYEFGLADDARAYLRGVVGDATGYGRAWARNALAALG